jgi:hypothetical protein
VHGFAFTGLKIIRHVVAITILYAGFKPLCDAYLTYLMALSLLVVFHGAELTGCA